MKIRVLSDLHIEFGDWEPPAVTADVVVLAGDIHVSTKGLAWARKHFPSEHIVYVAGNHEFYGQEMTQELEAMRRESKKLDIHFLDRDATVIEGARFLGATLWTDFKFDGETTIEQSRAKQIVLRGMNDYQLIELEGRKFHPDDAQSLCEKTLGWLEQQLSTPFDGSTIVVTHYLPHEKCISPRFRGNSLNPAFASHLPHLVRQPVTLWIHGHTHDSVDFTIQGTRVLCNPRGYAGYKLNDAFDPALIVKIS